MIRIEGLSKTFRTKDGPVEALRDVNLEIADGEIFGVIGYSGSGKSTLIRCINRLEEPDSGRITIGADVITDLPEKELRRRRQKIGIIFQHFNLLRNDTVYQNVARPLLYAGQDRQEAAQKVQELLRIVGLEDRAGSYPSQLSGGQKQRVAIARALAEDPDILLCDEATSALDPDTTRSILALLRDLNRTFHLTMIVVTHQMEVIRDLCTRVAVLDHGSVVDLGETLDIFARSDNPVTKQFANSLFQTEEIQNVIRSEAIQRTVRDGGRVVRLLFLGASADEAVISDVSRRFHLDANIIFGNIVMFQEQPVGNLYLSLSGPEAELEAAIAYIRGRQVIVDDIL